MGRSRYGESKTKPQENSAENTSQSETVITETSPEPEPITTPTSQNISDVIIENADPDKGFLTSSGTYVNVYKNAGTNERVYTSDNTVKPAGERIDPRSSEGQIIQQQYAEQADRRADNLAQSQRFWAIREGHGSVKNLLFESQTPEQRRLTEQFFEERNLDINTPLNQLSLSPKRYATAREQLTTGENIPKDGVKVPDSIWLKTDEPTQSELKSFEEYRAEIVKDVTTEKRPEDKITGVSEGVTFTSVSEIPLTEEQKKAIKQQVDEAREGDFNFITIIQQRDGVPDSTVTVPISGTNAYSLFEKQVKRVTTYGKPTDTVSISYHTEKNNFTLPENTPKIPINMPMPVASFLGGGLLIAGAVNQKQETETKPSYEEWLTGIPDPSFNQWNDGRDYRERGELGLYAPLQNYGVMGESVLEGGDIYANLQNKEFMDTGLDSLIRILQAGASPTSMGYEANVQTNDSDGRQRLDTFTDKNPTKSTGSLGAMSQQIAVEGELWAKYPQYYGNSLVTDIGMALLTLPVGGVVAQTSAKVAIATAKASVKIMPALSATNQLKVAVVARKLSSGTLKALPTVLLGGVSNKGSSVTLSALKNMNELELKAYNFVELRKAVDEAPVLSNFDGMRESEMRPIFETSTELTQREIDQIDPTSFKILQQKLDLAIVDGSITRQTLDSEVQSVLKYPSADQVSRSPLVLRGEFIHSGLGTDGSKLTIPDDMDWLEPISTKSTERTPMNMQSFDSSALPKIVDEVITVDAPRDVYTFPQTRLDILGYTQGREIRFSVNRGLDGKDPFQSFNVQTKIQPTGKGIRNKETKYTTKMFGGVGTEKQSFTNLFVDPSNETKQMLNLIPVEDARFPNTWKIPKTQEDVFEAMFIKYSTDGKIRKEMGAIYDLQVARGELGRLEKLASETKKDKIKKVKTKLTTNPWTTARRTHQAYKNLQKKKTKEDLKESIKTLKADITNEYLPKAKISALELFENQLTTSYIERALAKIPDSERQALLSDSLFADNVNLNKITAEERYEIAQKVADTKDRPVSIDDYYNIERLSGTDEVYALEGSKRIFSTESAFITADITESTKSRELAESIIEYRTLKQIQKELPSEKVALDDQINKSLLLIQQNIISTNIGRTGLEMPVKANTKTTKIGFTGSRDRITSDIDRIQNEIMTQEKQVSTYNKQIEDLEKRISTERDGQRNYIEVGKDSGVGFIDTNSGLFTQAQVNYVLEGYMQSKAVVQGIYKGVRPTVAKNKPFTGSKIPNPEKYDVEKTRVGADQLGSKTNYDTTVDNITIDDLMRDDITSVSADISETSFDQLRRTLTKDSSIQRVDESLGSADADFLSARTAEEIMEEIAKQRQYDRAQSVFKSSEDWLKKNLAGFDKPDISDQVLQRKKIYATEYNDSAGFFTTRNIRQRANPQDTIYNTGADVPNLQGTSRTIEPDSPEKTYLDLLRKQSTKTADSNVLGVQITDLKTRVKDTDDIIKKDVYDQVNKSLRENDIFRLHRAIKNIINEPYIPKNIRENLSNIRYQYEGQLNKDITNSYLNDKARYEALSIVKKEYDKITSTEKARITKRIKENPDTRTELISERISEYRTQIKQLQSDQTSVSKSLENINEKIESFDPEVKLKVGLDERSPVNAKLQASNKRVRDLEYQQSVAQKDADKLTYQIGRSQEDIKLLKSRYDDIPVQSDMGTLGAGWSISLDMYQGRKFDAKRVSEIKELLPKIGEDIPKTKTKGFYLERVIGDKNYTFMQNRTPDSLVFETDQLSDKYAEEALTRVNIKVSNANEQLKDVKNMIQTGDINTKKIDTVIENFDDAITKAKNDDNTLEAGYLKEAKKELENTKSILNKAEKIHKKKESQAKKYELKLEKVDSELDTYQDINWNNVPENSPILKKHDKLLKEQRELETKLEFRETDAKLTNLSASIPELRMSEMARTMGFNKGVIGRSNKGAFSGLRRFDFTEETGYTREQQLADMKNLFKEYDKTKRTKEQKTVYDAMIKAQSYNAVQPSGSPYMPIPIIRYPQNTPQDIQDSQIDVQSLPSDTPPQTPTSFALDVPTPQSLSNVTPNIGIDANVRISDKISTDTIPKLDTPSMLRILQPLNQKLTQPPIQTPIQTPIQNQFRIQAVRSPDKFKLPPRSKADLVPPIKPVQNVPTLPIPAFLPKLPYPTRKKKKKEKPKKKKYRKIYWDVSSSPFKPFNPKEYWAFKNEPRSVKFKEKRKNLD